jgi:hypothetical protein
MSEQKIELSAEDQKWFLALEKQVGDNDAELRRMTADNADYDAMYPRFVISTIVRGWSKFDVPFRMEGGYLASDLAPAVTKGLSALATANGIKDTSTPIYQLLTACSDQMLITEGDEKNSPAPLPNSSGLNGSTTETDNGASTGESGTEPNNSSTSPTPMTKSATGKTAIPDTPEA